MFRGRTMFGIVFLLGILFPFLCGQTVVYARDIPDVITPVVITDESMALPMPTDARSWYGTSMTLLTKTQTGQKYYDGNNIGIEMTCSSTTAGTFVVSLYRTSGTSAQFLGSANFKRQGFTKATWNGVGPGRYYFTFSKPNDGTIVRSYDVATYSW